MEEQLKDSKQRTLFDIIEEVDKDKKRKCDCWLEVPSCYCEIIKPNIKNEDTK